MELNEKYKAYQSEHQKLEGIDISDNKLRSFHISIENIFEDLISHKSSRDFKWLFILLISLVLIASAIHMGKFGISYNLIPPILLIVFWVYYRLQLKTAISTQAQKNGKINEGQQQNDNKQLLQNRAQYILNGIEVLEKRILLIRNQYVLFFPVFTILVIDIIKGPLSISAFIITVVLAIILGGLFWIYYFKNDLVDVESASEELEIIKEQLEQIN